jgi:DUF218 domain-containing protein
MPVGRRVVAVLGYSRGSAPALHPIARRRLRHAEGVAADADAVILSGWARADAPAAEAELMRDAWNGPDVPLVLDETARSTIGNAEGIARLARKLGAREVVVVTSRWHAPRAAALVRAALRGSGIVVEVSSADGGGERLLSARELVCRAALPVQTRRLTRRAS